MNTTASSTPHISSTTTSDGIAVEGTPGHGNWPRSNQQVDAIGPAGASDKRALVLAGAGAAGNAWELGLIAGTRPMGLGRFFANFDEDCDGTVAVSETKLPGHKAHLALPVSHMGMLVSPVVARQVASFLGDGRFDPA